MQIVKDGIVAEDRWRHLADEEAPAGEAITVSLPRWQAEKEALRRSGAQLGVRLRGQDPVEAIAEDLPSLALIVVEFPAMADGRGFSIARILRDRYGYEGEIRARGYFIRDQVYFLGRVGVNAFECAECADLENLVSALTDFSVNYQAAADDRTPLYRKRA